MRDEKTEREVDKIKEERGRGKREKQRVKEIGKKEGREKRRGRGRD